MTAYPAVPPVPPMADKGLWTFLTRLKQCSDLLTGATGGLQPLQLPAFPVAQLPAASPGLVAWAQDGLKPGESHGNGSGVPVYADKRQWYVMGTSTVVGT